MSLSTWIYSPPVQDVSEIFHRGCVEFKWSSPMQMTGQSFFFFFFFFFCKLKILIVIFKISMYNAFKWAQTRLVEVLVKDYRAQ